MTGIYLECDKCGATIDGVEVVRDLVDSTPLRWTESRFLRICAKDRGWTYQIPNNDLCPVCSKPKENEK